MKTTELLEIVDALICMAKTNTEFGCVLCTSNITFEEYFNASTVRSKWTNRKNIEAGVYAYLTDEESTLIETEADVVLVDNCGGGYIYFWKA